MNINFPDTVLIVGLGNPGSKYENTRHNLGFRVIDGLRNSLQSVKSDSSRWYDLYKGHHARCRILCLYPLTYMNRSGIAVSDVAYKYSVEPENCIVIFDDINLPLGSIRIRPAGSSGGHNGMQSVIEALATDSVPRVRLGIYNERTIQSGTDSADFVLSEFTDDEKPVAANMIKEAADAVLMMMGEGIQKAMNNFNKITDPENMKQTK